MAQSVIMRHGTGSWLLAATGVVAFVYPSAALFFTTPETYEVEITRWFGLVLIGLAAVRPWALRTGGLSAQRLRRWEGAAGATAILYGITVNPLFLLVSFASTAAGVLDAVVQRATDAAFALRASLEADEA